MSWSAEGSTKLLLRRARLKRIGLSAFVSLAARATGMVITLITVPLTLRYLGTERFAVWITLSSIASLLAFADLGIGNGLINFIAKAYANDDRDMAKHYVSSAFLTLVGIAMAMGLCFSLVFSSIPWSKVYNAQETLTIVEAGPATAVFIFCFLINLPLGIIQKIQIGYQEIYIDNAWVIVGKVLSVITLLIAISLNASLSGLVLALVGTPLLTTVANAVYLFFYRRRWLLPRVMHFNIKIAQQLFRAGVLFFILQIAGTLAYSIDNIIIAHVISADAVTSYAVPAQLFRITNATLGAVLVGLWPAYSEAFARQDLEWVETTFKHTLLLVFLFSSVVALILFTFGQTLINLWIGYPFQIPLLLMLGLGVWSVVMNVAVVFALLLNAANAIKFQIACAVAMSVSNLGLSVLLTSWIGISGVLWGSISSYLVFVIVPYVIFIPRLFHSLKSAPSGYL